MATITLEVPNEIAEWFEGRTDELPAMLLKLAKMEGAPKPDVAWGDHEAWVESLQFLADAPSAQAIIDFKLSDPLQDRLEELLERNSESELLPHEQEELDGFIQTVRLFNLLKAVLRATLN